MPAVTLSRSTVHRSQNCGVRIAWSTCTSPPAATVRRGTLTPAPVGVQPGAGSRTVKTPNSMNAKYATPITTNVSATPRLVALRKRSINPTASGDPIIAPPPNPMIARPVAIPGRSGNHLISVDTGEM